MTVYYSDNMAPYSSCIFKTKNEMKCKVLLCKVFLICFDGMVIQDLQLPHRAILWPFKSSLILPQPTDLAHRT